jgi:putative N6-adenine-specific DNA methylase
MAELDSETFPLIATTAFGLEAVVSRELKALGFEGVSVEDGRVLFDSDVSGIARANLWLRSADRVQLIVGRFDAYDFGELFDQTRALPWERWLGRLASFPVRGRSARSQLHSVPDCQRIVKKAIVERLKDCYEVDWLEETGVEYQIDVALVRDQVTLTINTTGDALNKRGYRKLTAKAPLRETLAAALVQLSVWHPDRPFVDPFCGSGTLPIEAAMIARNLAPGLNREFAAGQWPQIPKTVWDEARTEAKDLVRPKPEDVLIGTDIDDEVLSLARYHARQAGVEDCVHFQQRAFADLKSQRKFGCVVTNPPYGERLSDAKEVEQLYRTMPGVFGELDTWSFFVLTSVSEFERQLRRKATRRRKLFNGNLECTYYQMLGPKPPQMHRGEPAG